MMRKMTMGLITLVILLGVAWLSATSERESRSVTDSDWVEVTPGIYRTTTLPYGYALLDDGKSLLIDAPESATRSRPDNSTIDRVLLTHHHRDTVEGAATFLERKIPVLAPKDEAEWLTPEGVATFWAESIPLRTSRTAYFVLPVGLSGAESEVDCTLEDGQRIDWGRWTIDVIGTPGHSRGHLSFAVTPRDDSEARPWVFCGDALCEVGKIWSPFTTDWDHWTDAGQKTAAESLRKLAKWKPRGLLPAHGPVITDKPNEALTKTADALAEVGFLKSFERYSDRLGNAPEYAYLAEDQVGSAGQKPWTQVSEHLWLTGNTYVLVSEQNKAFLVIDPWAERGANQVAKLKEDENLGPLEVVWFTHAHYDHFDGLYHLPDRERFQVWSLDLVAEPLKDPFRLRAPFLDARPIRFDQTFTDGDTATWREYRFKFTHLPGQSYFTMGVQTSIDGKRCFFTADNFFHMRQYSGTGGWMGLNRATPTRYGQSAQAVLDAKPEWVLAEHGGPFVFDAEDFRRRVKWGEVGAVAANAVCVSGEHHRDWDPHRVRVEPLAQKAKAGETIRATMWVDNAGPMNDRVQVRIDGRGVFPDQGWDVTVMPGRSEQRPFRIRLPENLSVGRLVFAVRNADPDGREGVDAFFAIDVIEE